MTADHQSASEGARGSEERSADGGGVVEQEHDARRTRDDLGAEARREGLDAASLVALHVDEVLGGHTHARDRSLTQRGRGGGRERERETRERERERGRKRENGRASADEGSSGGRGRATADEATAGRDAMQLGGSGLSGVGGVGSGVSGGVGGVSGGDEQQGWALARRVCACTLVTAMTAA
jgi:hypothetical protein